MMIFSIPFILMFHIIPITEGMKEGRHVVRENNPIDMQCAHGLETVTRVTWEYISTIDARSAIIYDSQSNLRLRPGLEVSCQPHQSIISTCTLKLVQARKEDSGKYICYVGEGSDAKIDSNLKTITEIEIVVRGPKYKTIVANSGDPVILQCEHNIKNLTRARWSHVSLQNVMNYKLYQMSWSAATNNNYEGLCEPRSLSCNLKILEANKESAGKYICMVGESQEFEEKYGLYEMTYFIEIELLIGELVCNENNQNGLILIGENDCYGIEADVLNLKCSFNYFGNINYNLLRLRWIEKYKFNSLEKKLNSSLINHEVKDETKKISIQTSLSVAYEMQNSTFQCVLDDTLVKPCQLQEFEVQYIQNATERHPSMNSNDLHDLKCEIKKSENVQCSHYWVHEIAETQATNTYLILPESNKNSPGNYTCIAKCHLGKHKECTIKAMEFEVIHKTYFSSLIIGLITGILIAAASIAVVTCIFFRKKLHPCNVKRTHKAKKGTRLLSKTGKDGSSKIDEECEKEVNDECLVRIKVPKNSRPFNVKDDHKQAKEVAVEETNDDKELTDKCKTDKGGSSKIDEECEKEIYGEGLVRIQESKKPRPFNVKDDHKQEKEVAVEETNDDKELTDKCETVKDGSSKTAEKQKVNTKPLVMESYTHVHIKKTKVLFQKKVNDEGLVKIQESPMHGKELTIDDVIYEREGDYVNEQEILSKLQVSCHQNPKNILLIGIGTGRIVKGLLELLENKKITEFNITVFELNKEIYEPYCVYFPSMAGYLEHPKVKLIIQNPTKQSIIDGIEFIKRQKNAFDVIINHTHGCRNIHLISERYFEELLAALKGGGIVSLIFIGDTIDNILEQAESNCYKHFPKVEVFPSNDNNGSNAVFKFLACTHNLKIDLCNLKEAFEGEIKASKTLLRMLTTC